MSWTDRRARANLAAWPGLRLGGAILAALGASLLAGGAAALNQSYLLIGLATLIGGGAVALRSDGAWRIGRGLFRK